MTNFINLISNTADKFENLIKLSSSTVEEIPTEDFGWINNRYQSEKFRMAHIERFEQPQFSVLHTVIFPHTHDPSPIFGFDIIASDTKATGVFFDLSPTLDDWGPLTDLEFSNPRERPSWGEIFSPNWIACRPSFEEAETITELACQTLTLYLTKLNTQSSSNTGEIMQLQNRYSLNQRQNEHTTRVLFKILGQERGKYFVENILFPTV